MAWNVKAVAKWMLVTFIIFIFGFFAVKPAKTQEVGSEAFNQSFQEYRSRIEEYEAAHDDYELARSQYLKFNTLAARTNAQEKTKTMLRARNYVIISYLNLLKTRASENKGIESGDKDKIYTQADEEKGWFEDNNQKISEASSLDDLVDLSGEARDKYNSLDPFKYKSLFTLTDGRINEYQNRLNSIFVEIKEKVEIIKNEKREKYQFSDGKIDIIERWINEAENRAEKSEENQLLGREKAERIINLGTYNTAINFLEDARAYTKESTSYVKEIVREIKTAED